MKRSTFFLAIVLFLGSGPSAWANSATVAAAAGMKFALGEIVTEFQKAHPEDTIKTVYGATGKLQTQIQQGAPFDLFFAADTLSPHALAKAGFAGSSIKIYAIGRLVLWSTTVDASKLTIANLIDPRFDRIAIGNPKVVPYGKRAKEALRASKLWEKVLPRLVYGENITQTAQFVESGNAQVGLIALSLAKSPELSKKGAFALVPENLHQPLEHGLILTKRGAENDVAKRFASFVDAKQVQTILVRYGYAIPKGK